MSNWDFIFWTEIVIVNRCFIFWIETAIANWCFIFWIEVVIINWCFSLIGNYDFIFELKSQLSIQ